MASIIRIKRSGVQGNPSLLGQGELAYSYFNGAGGDRLYIGTGTETAGDAVNHTVIGGKYYTDLLGGEGEAPFGVLTANTAIIVDADGKINEFKVDDLVFDGSVVSTVTGDLVFTPASGQNIDVSGTRITNLAEPVDSADATTKFYVDNTLANFVADALAPTGVVAGSYGSQTSIPTFSVDSDGRLSAAGEVNVATNLTVNGDSISLLDSDLHFEGSTNVDVNYDSLTNTVSTVLKTDVTGLNSLEVGNLRLEGNTLYSTDSSNTLYLDPAPTDSDGGTLVIRGDLVVQGTQTIINSTVMSVNDLTLTLADEATTPAEADGAGIYIAGADASLVYDAANDVIDINKGLNVTAPFSINGIGINQVIDSEVADLLTAGEGIDLVYNDALNELTISAELATTTNVGVASFDSDQFIVTAGAASIYQIDGGTY